MKKIFRFKILLPAIICAFCLLAAACPAGAQGYVVAETEVDPKIIDERLKARDIRNYTVTIHNKSDMKVDIYVLVNDVSEVDGEQEFNPAGDWATSLAKWISIRRGVIEVPPRSTTTEELKINVDMRAEPGRYYAAITFAQGNNRSLAQSNAKRFSFPRIMINVAVEEQIVEKSQIRSFRADKDVYLKPPVGFELSLGNMGNREIFPEGTIYIYDRRGVEVDQLDVSGLLGGIGAGEDKAIRREWTRDGLLGKYKARVELNYGQEDERDLMDTVYFWFLPFKYLLIFSGGVVLLITLLVYFLFRKTYHHHQAAIVHEPAEPVRPAPKTRVKAKRPARTGRRTPDSRRAPKKPAPAAGGEHGVLDLRRKS